MKDIPKTESIEDPQINLGIKHKNKYGIEPRKYFRKSCIILTDIRLFLIHMNK